MSKGDLSAHQKVYVFKSGNVIELLKSLQAKFEEDRVDATKAETNAQNAYELSEDARSKAIATAKSAKKEKETILGDVQSDLEETKATLKSCIDDLEADEKSLASTEESCKLKAGEYATRVELQQGEQAAMAKAIEILSDVTGVRTEQPTNPVPPPSPWSPSCRCRPRPRPGARRRWSSCGRPPAGRAARSSPTWSRRWPRPPTARSRWSTR
jgi:DNA repair exonuclease SbcCD ATPase subunit